MKSHKLLLLYALALLPWHAAGAQSANTTLVAQAAAPQQPMPTADEKTAPANAIGKPVPGARTTDGKKCHRLKKRTGIPRQGLSLIHI